MEYYCLMVKTRGEEKFKKRLEKSFKLAGKDIDVIFFKKKVRDKNNVEREEPLFKSYVFLAVKAIDLETVSIVKRTEDFYKFLNSNRDIKPLRGTDLEIVSNLMNFGETQGLSKIYFDEDMHIVVTDGPMAGFLGKIYKVNKRQRRVTVLLEMFHNQIKFDLGYELVRPDPAYQEKQKKS
ncbi:MAG: hypothetical protein II837_04080 [Treponema sp.]|nr:hypothetical protein [Treponema sp.]MBQ7165386.1 hypothetical protein [Treponema sp.]